MIDLESHRQEEEMNMNDETRGDGGSFQWLIILGSVFLSLAAVGVMVVSFLLSS
jgi:hypothetical protein